MESSSLQFPFSWKERAPLLADGILHIPKLYAKHEEWPKEDLNRLLSSFSSISVEYGSGNGAWVAEKAEADPSVLWIAVEKRFDRVRKIRKKRKEGRENLLIVYGDAVTFTNSYLGATKIDRIFVNFPDPWPKPRHAKHRLIQTGFVRKMGEVLKESGEVVLVTDDPEYADQILREMNRDGVFGSCFPPPHYILDWPSYGTSFFEDLWRTKNKRILYMKFQKKETI